MKPKILTLLLLCLPILLGAQNYEQQGDELFAQAQYEKAEKKYAAAIEMSGANSSLQSKKENSAKCASLLTSAKKAEETASSIADYENASKLYSDLYAIHALQSYKSKADTLKRKATNIEQENVKRAAQAERAEQERKLKEAEEARVRAEQERIRKYEEDRMHHRGRWRQNYMEYIKNTVRTNGARCTQPSSRVIEYEWFLDRNKKGEWIDYNNLALTLEVNNYDIIEVKLQILHQFRSELKELLISYPHPKIPQVYDLEEIDIGVLLLKQYDMDKITPEKLAPIISGYTSALYDIRGRYDADRRSGKRGILSLSTNQNSYKNSTPESTPNKQNTNKNKPILSLLISYPMGIESLQWTDAFSAQKKVIFDTYPALKENSKNNYITGKLVPQIVLSDRSVEYVVMNYMKDETFIRYTIDSKGNQQQIIEDLYDGLKELFLSVPRETINQEKRKVEKDPKSVKCKRFIGSPSKLRELTIEFMVY